METMAALSRPESRLSLRQRRFDDFERHPKLERIIIGPIRGLTTPLILDSRPRDGIIVRSFEIDREETLFHLRYTAGQSPPPPCRSSRVPPPRRSSRVKKKADSSTTIFDPQPLPRAWQNLVLFRGTENPNEVAFRRYTRRQGWIVDWTEPQRRIILPESSWERVSGVREAARDVSPAGCAWRYPNLDTVRVNMILAL